MPVTESKTRRDQLKIAYWLASPYKDAEVRTYERNVIVDLYDNGTWALRRLVVQHRVTKYQVRESKKDQWIVMATYNNRDLLKEAKRAGRSD